MSDTALWAVVGLGVGESHFRELSIRKIPTEYLKSIIKPIIVRCAVCIEHCHAMYKTSNRYASLGVPSTIIM